MKTFKHTLLISFIAAVLAGCGAGPQPMATADMNKSFEANTKVRAIFDAAGGDFEKVSESDKKFLVERFKSEEKAKEAFEAIKHPPGGMPGAPGAPGGPGAPAGNQ